MGKFGCAGLGLLTGTATACPVCDTPTGIAIREQIFTPQFGYYALLTLLPLLLLAQVAYMLYRGAIRVL